MHNVERAQADCVIAQHLSLHVCSKLLLNPRQTPRGYQKMSFEPRVLASAFVR